MKVFFVSFLLVLSFNLHSQNSSSFLQQLSAGEGLTSEETTIYNTIVGNDRVTDHMIISVQSPTNGISGENYFAVNIPATMISAEECDSFIFKISTSRYVDDYNYYLYGQLKQNLPQECTCHSGEIMLENVGGGVNGYLQVDEVRFEIHALSISKGLLVKVQPSFSEVCIQPQPNEDESTEKPAVSTDSRASTTCKIKVLFLYDPATAAARTPFAINNLTNLAISQTNQAFATSSISNVEVVKVGNLLLPGFIQTTIGDPATNILADLALLPTLASNLRASYQADVVCLVVSSVYRNILYEVNGVADPANLGSPSFASAYMIVEDDAMTSAEYVFTHEFGHILSCRHQTCATFSNGGCDDGGTFEHGHGWGERKSFFCKWKNYSTVMHQPRNKNTRLLRFSNPDLSHNGYPTGVQDISDNAQQISATRGCIVANYFADSQPTLTGVIDGPDVLCVNSIETYYALPPVSNGYSFIWHKSLNGVNWGQPIGTSQSIQLDGSNYSAGQTIFLRVAMYDNSSNQVIHAFFEIEVVDQLDAICPRSNKVNEIEKFQASFSPNPAHDELLVSYQCDSDTEFSLSLHSVLGVQLYQYKLVAQKGANLHKIALNSEWQGPLVIHISSSGKTITTSIILQK
jgi:hypothetical protein